jgi:hypothetical protein
MLARAFGCRRVVFMDVIRSWAEAYQSKIWDAAEKTGGAQAGVEDPS